MQTEIVNQFRRPDETEHSLLKYWKNLKGTQSKFLKPFKPAKFTYAPPKGQKLTSEEKRSDRLAQEVFHEEGVAHAETKFNECKRLIEELKDKEVLLKSGEQIEPKKIEEAKTARDNVRASRLARYEEMSKRDEEFQANASKTLAVLAQSLQASQANFTLLTQSLQQLFTAMQEREARKEEREAKRNEQMEDKGRR